MFEGITIVNVSEKEHPKNHEMEVEALRILFPKDVVGLVHYLRVDFHCLQDATSVREKVDLRPFVQSFSIICSNVKVKVFEAMFGPYG